MPAIKRMESWTVCWSVVTDRTNDYSSGILIMTQQSGSRKYRSRRRAGLKRRIKSRIRNIDRQEAFRGAVIVLIVFLAIFISLIFSRRNVANPTVYISVRGSSDYHVKGCSLLSAEKIKVKRSVAIERGYNPCEKCILRINKNKETKNNKQSLYERRK